MLTTIISYMNETEVINISKRCSDKKAERERVIKSPVFLFDAIWSHLAHSWPRIKCICKI